MTILRNMKIGSQTKAYIFLIITLIIFFSPFFIYGKFTVLPIIDNLDCYYVWNKIVAQPVYVFTGPSTNIQEFMNGLPKFTLLNSFTIFYLLNIFFSSFYAVALHIFLIHLVACFSMYLLASKHLSSKSQSASIIAALLFGLQAFIYAYGLSLSLLPLLIVVFIRMYNKESEKKDWILIFLYPFLSNLQSVGIFIIFLWIFLSALYFIQYKKINLQLLIAVSLLCVIYYLNNFPTINNLLFNTYFISHRNDFKFVINQHFVNQTSGFSFWALLKFFFSLKIFVVGMVVLFIMFKKNEPQSYLLLILLLLGVFFESGLFLLNNEVVATLKGNFRLLKMFHFEKILVFKSFTLASIYAIIFGQIFSLFKQKWIQYSFLIITPLIVIPQTLCWKPLLGLSWQEEGRSFEGYYSPDIFKKIKTTIHLPVNKYKVASFGINPAVSQFNGMYTIDGYINNYPIEYKMKFKEVIKTDLDSIHKNIGFKDWDFETTGHRCYLQNEYLIKRGGPSLLIDKINPLLPDIQIVHWNFKALKALGCNYIISTNQIQTDSTNNIELQNQFENKYYILYLYKLI